MLSVGSQNACQSHRVLTPMLSPARSLLLGLPPFELDGVSVVIDGLAFAPILAVSVPQSGNAQMNILVPLERNPSLLSVTPNSPGGISVLVNLNVVATQTPVPPPESGGFFLDQNGNMLAHGVTPRPLFSINIGLMINPTSLREFLGNPS
jgi:uncharacterized protein (TIGR03437 family)